MVEWRLLIECLLNRVFSKKEIPNCDHDTYLHRWYVIRTAPFALFIHKFIRSDEDRALHDHPWNFLVIPIWRGYIEHSERDMTTAELWDHFEHPFNGATTVPVVRRVWPIIGARFRRGTYKHRVELLQQRVDCCPECGAGDSLAIPGYPQLVECNQCGHPYDVITEPLPSWSIFIRFREFRDWGFHLPEGWMQWNKFWKEKCE